jgi:hypothetical protein
MAIEKCDEFDLSGYIRYMHHKCPNKMYTVPNNEGAIR